MMLFEPTTFVLRADSSGGLNVTLPAPLMMMSVSRIIFFASFSSRPRYSLPTSPLTGTTLALMKSSKPSPYFSRSGSNVGLVTMLVQNRIFDSLASRARTVAYTFPISGKLCNSIDSVTLPTKPVPPIKKIFLPLNISVGDSFISSRSADTLVRIAGPAGEMFPVIASRSSLQRPFVPKRHSCGQACPHCNRSRRRDIPCRYFSLIGAKTFRAEAALMRTRVSALRLFPAPILVPKIIGLAAPSCLAAAILDLYPPYVDR